MADIAVSATSKRRTTRRTFRRRPDCSALVGGLAGRVCWVMVSSVGVSAAVRRTLVGNRRGCRAALPYNKGARRGVLRVVGPVTDARAATRRRSFDDG